MASSRKVSKKKPTKSLIVYLIGLLLLLGVSGFGIYRLFSSRLSSKAPLFETYASHGTEARIKEFDRRMCDALLALGVPAEDVQFNSVETKWDDADQWTYSELQVRLRKALSRKTLKAIFSREISGRVQGTSLSFKGGPSHKIILTVSIDGHPTHRLVFLPFVEKAATPSHPPGLPRVAIIIDDMGYDTKMASNFLELDGVLSFSVLPNSPFQQQIASAIHKMGRDVLLHLPMEPIEYPHVNPGVGALISSMSPEELLDQLNKNLDAVPYIVGVNNHMGSKLTQDSAKMRQIFTVLKKRNLFFVDSLTSPKSHCLGAAKLLKLKFGRRNVFLDHVQDTKTIRFQIKRLVSVAKTRGYAIGIGHPYATTLEVLREDLPNIKRKVDLVPVSQVVG
ncbi:MAG: divergent polysaccharide deacetylase family protein [Deltaproteobacteria bacterium]|nr:divergent polysaccharide deacetylase family protein [Deltaproteobacteria bacterium]